VIRVACVLALALWPALASAASLVLSEAERQTAIHTGERSVTDPDGFDQEWRVTNSAGESAVVMTPFHRLAAAARHATFSGKPLKAGEPDKVLNEGRDRLVFWVQLRGDSAGFARYYVARLVVGDREIKASFVQNERTAMHQEDRAYLARCLYGFPTRDVKGNDRLALIVADADGRDVTRFTIDLARMR
jgi:hypothetical protein